MIPYELIVTSASRPHLLQPTLESLLRRVDQAPTRILIHDDAAFQPGTLEADHRWMQMKAVLGELALPCETLLHHADPPRRLGLALNWLLAQVQTEYVLYSQDDFVTVRSVPIIDALDLMHHNNLHQIRFNKRATMAFKDTWAGRWTKEECTYMKGVDAAAQGGFYRIVTTSDHWYFQLALCRVSELRRALAFWTENPERTRRLAVDEPEGMINHYFDHIAYGGDPADPRVRSVCQKTFIWGPIGEDRYIRHIGGDRDDWAGDHLRSGAIDDAAKAWREIASYDKEGT